MRSFLRTAHHRQRMVVVASTILILIGLTACGTPGATLGTAQSPSAMPMSSTGTPSTATIILFNGTGTSSSDVSAVEAILTANNLGYITKNSSQIEAMSESQLAGYKLLIVPGGNSITIGDNLTTAATTNIHNAVVNDGLHYLGICAGGFFGGYSIYNGLNLTSGHWFDFYQQYYDGYHKLAVLISTPTGSPLDQYWQDGPEFNGWGSIVGKYPDGTPAIVEGASGKGWVMLSGIHPEAPASWRYGMTFTTSVATDNAYAGTLILAALNRTTLSHY